MGLTRNAGKLPAELRHRFLQRRRRNVNGIEQRAALPLQQFLNQNAGLGGGAGAQFDQRQRRSGLLAGSRRRSVSRIERSVRVR